ncbi:hypothetical protein [Coleofasciculus sp. FACHB-129]|uniref:hypothetical protein n=1 Tax=Cyanophyceae TaxID=3028117 RepID=UPI00168494BD|nr:hypothetical protein [Coleofasciculus sp. FACHB-129]MBD1898190.1 hypothetical protein [Coleofasciculus sp. FACHB-129]
MGDFDDPFPIPNESEVLLCALDDAGSLSKRRSAPETKEIEIEEAIASCRASSNKINSSVQIPPITALQNLVQLHCGKVAHLVSTT